MFNVHTHGTELGFELGTGDSSLWKKIVSRPKIARFLKNGKNQAQTHTQRTSNLFFF
jgi:hypothetical protein